MPGYKMHLFGGAIAATLMLYIPPTTYIASMAIEQKFFYSTLALLGALFPDIDIKSKGQKIFSRIIFIPICISIITRKFYYLALFTLLAVFPLLIKHRGITHNPWFLFLIPTISFCIAKTYTPLFQQNIITGSIFFTAGAFSHLVLDFGPIKLFTRDKRGF